ncbi:Uncharacterized protein OBRU01_23571, partial [Operophtera brumata]
RLIPGVLGCIYGSNLHIFTPKKEIEDLFFCRKHFYSINIQMICDSECIILNVNPKYGGATHDAFIWENSAANECMSLGLHLWVTFPYFYPKKEIEDLFFCRKHFYSINIQMICDSECIILNVNPKYGMGVGKVL